MESNISRNNAGAAAPEPGQGGFRSWCRKHPLLWGLCMMAVAVLVLAWLSMMFLSFWTHHGENATVPQIRHKPYTEAAAILNQAGLSIEISDSVYDTSVPAGTVMESWPKAGSQVKSGRSVYVTVTAFSPKHVTLSMPVTGVSVRQAVSYLNALGITGIRFVNVPSDFPDLVEHASANGRPLGVGSVVAVDASVVLEVGVARAAEFSDSIDSDIDVPAVSVDAPDDYSSFEDEDL